MLSLLRQVIQLLSESPGNIVYHLVTLFALQAIFAISFSQWRRNRQSGYAFRVMAAAGTILIIRVIQLVISLFVVGDAFRATAVLPLLDQAVNTAIILLMSWALVPHSKKLPRLVDLFLLMGLLITGAMYASFAQSWQTQAAAGIAYNSTTQATVWGLVQMSVLAGSTVLVLLHPKWRRTLSPLILGLLLLTHIAHFWNYPEIIPTETNITYWIRLGHLCAIPLWAVMAYRQSLLPLVAVQRSLQSPHDVLQSHYQQLIEVLRAETVETAVQQAITLFSQIFDASFVGIGFFGEDRPHLSFTSNLPQIGSNRPRMLQINTNDWSAIQVALNQQRQIELRADGAGSGQLFRLYESLELGAFGTLIIEPLLGETKPEGLLLLAQSEAGLVSHPDDLSLAPILASFLMQIIHNITVEPASSTGIALPTNVLSAPELEPVISGRIISLEEEQVRLKEALTVANSRLQQAEGRAVAAGKRAHDLAAAMTEMEQINQDERVLSLEQAVETLRESLMEAEEALALASAGEGGLSTEWVMLTITRYSGQLEEAQAHIISLEQELARREFGTADPVIISLVQELRTPMTSIAGFAHLMLSETMGILGVKQRDGLQRIKANSERMGALLDQIVQLTAPQEKSELTGDEVVDVREVIETAVNGIITQIREKRLQLDLDIAEDLPTLSIDRQDLHQILTNLLGNACQASASDGRITVTAHADVIASNSEAPIRFVQLAVTDSGGGIPVHDHARVFAPQHHANTPLIPGLGDTGAGLSMARKLTQTNGGRIWLDSKVGGGSTFSLLFPIINSEHEATGPQNGSHPGK
ncbi:MAG: HAMP domain-containing histidine kinase [Chloroflexi bacterium]|nr:HAMP domain-containing histidine kinase [Chloroflexota bacterium]